MSDVETVVPEGYQKTKIGLIPSDWGIPSLKELATKSNSKNKDGQCEIVFSISASQGIVLQSEYFEKDIANSDNTGGYYLVETNDFVYNPRISSNAPAGPIHLSSHSDTGLVSPLYTVFRFKKNEHIEFFRHLFKSHVWVPYMQRVSNYGARHDRMSVTNDVFFAMPLPLPPLPEQQRIATILNTWDEAITKQANLIALKEQRKRGLMQQLLTGAVRFPGFDGEWMKIELTELLVYKQSTHYSVDKAEYDDSYCTPVLTAGKGFLLGYTNETNNVFTEYPTIIFDDFTTSNHFVNFAFKVKSSAMKMLLPKNDDVNLKYVYLAMQMIQFTAIDHKRYWISEYQFNIIHLPNAEEQKKIVEFFDVVAQEIDQLNKQLEALKEQKRGLMQKLLTGQVRVNVA